MSNNIKRQTYLGLLLLGFRIKIPLHVLLIVFGLIGILEAFCNCLIFVVNYFIHKVYLARMLFCHKGVLLAGMT